VVTVWYHFIVMLGMYDVEVLKDSAPVGLSGEAAPLYGLVAMWALTVMVVTSVGIVRNKMYDPLKRSPTL